MVPDRWLRPRPSPYQMIAAEVIQDGMIQTDDAAWIMCAALKPASSPIGHWSFIAEGQDLSDVSRFAASASPAPTLAVVNNTTSNWIGILLGDVDGSWNPNLPL